MSPPCVETRQDLMTAICERYQGGTKDNKLRILDEFVAITGYHRKHAIRLFKLPGPARRRCGLADPLLPSPSLAACWSSARPAGEMLP